MKNWRTTVLGIGSAIGITVLQLISTGTVDIKTLAVAGALAGLGYISKDAGVSGTEK